MTPVIEILQEFLFLSVVFKLVDNIVNGALSNRSKLSSNMINLLYLSIHSRMNKGIRSQSRSSAISRAQISQW